MLLCVPLALLALQAAPRVRAPMMVGSTKGSNTSPFDTLQRFASPQTATVARELLEIAFQQDPQVVLRRSFDLSRALNVVAGEALSRPLDPTAAPYLLRRLCEELGATYVKLGQFVASSPTLFPAEFVAEFQRCLDQTPPMPWADVKGLIESELGKPIDRVYKNVERAPLASASIAQVHAATLLTGEDVVIKVQKKDVQGSLRADLDLIYSLSRSLEIGGLATAELREIVKSPFSHFPPYVTLPFSPYRIWTSQRCESHCTQWFPTCHTRPFGPLVTRDACIITRCILVGANAAQGHP